MANTYYKYAEREADSYVNWAEIGKSMSDMLANENKIREEKKAAIDQASREYGEYIDSFPRGENKGLEEYSLKFSGELQSARLMQDTLLKSGQLKLNDYLIMRQNTNSGTKKVYNLIENFQKNYAEKWDRMKGGISSDLEPYMMAYIQKFADFQNTKLFVNPSDGSINIGFLEDQEIDGKTVKVMKKTSNDSADINTLLTISESKFDKYDWEKNIDSFVEGLGEEINVLVKAKNTYGSTGLISEILDITNRTNFPTDAAKVKELYEKAKAGGYKGTKEDWLKDQNNLKATAMSFYDVETKALQARMTNAYDVATILTNYLDIEETTRQPYEFTFDEKDLTDPKYILLKNTGNSSEPPKPVLSDKQKEAALEYLRIQARLKYDKKEKGMVTSQLEVQHKTEAEMTLQERKKLAENVAQNLVWTLTGNAAEADAGTQYLSARGKLQTKKGKDGIIFTNDKGTVVQNFAFEKDGIQAEDYKLVKSMIGSLSENMGINEEDVLNAYNRLRPKNAKINRTTEAVGYRKVEQGQGKLDK